MRPGALEKPGGELWLAAVMPVSAKREPLSIPNVAHGQTGVIDSGSRSRTCARLREAPIRCSLGGMTECGALAV